MVEVTQGSQGKVTDSLIVNYILTNGDSNSFTNYFWKKCEPNEFELNRFALYVRVIDLFHKGDEFQVISEKTGVKQQSVRRWTNFEQRPKLVYFLGAFITLGMPRPDWVWLSVNNTPGHAVPLGPFVEVPKVISNWEDVKTVLCQLKPVENLDSDCSKEYMFGFLLGMVIGDSSKSRTKNWHRHLGLVLSKKYDANEKLGDFTCHCAQSIGLRMHRVADQPKPKSKPNGFFQWVSQASPLVDWIFNSCLSLRDGERTTYDSVRMEWVMGASEDFRRGLVQGIAESDGSVSIASQTVEFWIGPNWDFGKKLLSTFRVKSFRNREALSVTKTEVSNLGRIPAFSSRIRTVRYERIMKLVLARHIEHGHRLPTRVREFIGGCDSGMTVPQVSELVLDVFGVVVNFETVRRWLKRGTNPTVKRPNEPK